MNQKNWGLFNWGKKLIDLIINLQSDNVDNIMKTLINKNYLRINFQTDFLNYH